MSTVYDSSEIRAIAKITADESPNAAQHVKYNPNLKRKAWDTSLSSSDSDSETSQTTRHVHKKKASGLALTNTAGLARTKVANLHKFNSLPQFTQEFNPRKGQHLPPSFRSGVQGSAPPEMITIKAELALESPQFKLESRSEPVTPPMASRSSYTHENYVNDLQRHIDKRLDGLDGEYAGVFSPTPSPTAESAPKDLPQPSLSDPQETSNDEADITYIMNVFRGAGVPVDDPANPVAAMAKILAEMTASITRSLQSIQDRQDVHANWAYGEFTKIAKDIGANNAERERLESDFTKFQKRASQTKLRAQVSEVEKEVSKLRAPDVTLEKMQKEIAGMHAALAGQSKSIADFKGACEAELKRLATSRKEFNKEVRGHKVERKDNLEDLENSVIHMDADIYTLQAEMRGIDTSLEAFAKRMDEVEEREHGLYKEVAKGRHCFEKRLEKLEGEVQMALQMLAGKMEKTDEEFKQKIKATLEIWR